MKHLLLLCVSLLVLQVQTKIYLVEIKKKGDDQPANPVTELIDDFWLWRFNRSPEFGTLAGDKMFSSRLATFTEERFAKDYRTCRGYQKRARALLNSNIRDPALLLNLKAFLAHINTFLDGYAFKGFQFPVNYLEGVQVDFQSLATDWFHPITLTDYENLITRYKKFQRQANEIVGLMRGAIAQKRTYHAVSMKGVVNQCRGHLGKPQETVFFAPFKQPSLNITDNALAGLQASAHAAIQTSVQQGFQILATFLSEEYLPHTRPNMSASSISAEYYAACLAFHTSTNLTAQEIHEMGVKEVARIKKEMEKIRQELGYTNITLQELSTFLRNDKRNFFTTPEELLDTVKDIIQNRIESKLLDIFHYKPTTKLDIVKVQENRPESPPASYTAGSLDRTRPGKIYINHHFFRSLPRYMWLTTVLHEANPGHNLQSDYSLAQTGWPAFRKISEDYGYGQAPSRFSLDMAYREGWALYSEQLGFDMGLFHDPLDRYGHLSLEMFRACRMVVDTGIHALDWTHHQAVQYMADNIATSLEEISQEVDRYVTWPGQATAYKIGQLKISELRARAETILATKFNIKDFHQVVLDSLGPLSFLEEQVDSWINNQQRHS